MIFQPIVLQINVWIEVVATVIGSSAAGGTGIYKLIKSHLDMKYSINQLYILTNNLSGKIDKLSNEIKTEHDFIIKKFVKE